MASDMNILILVALFILGVVLLYFIFSGGLSEATVSIFDKIKVTLNTYTNQNASRCVRSRLRES